MSKILFTSDLHLDDKDTKVTQLRGFGHWLDHIGAVAHRWKLAVAPQDRVYVVGDLATGRDGLALEILQDLPGEKHLILGNHDAGHPSNRNAYKKLARYSGVFASVASSGVVRLGGQDVLLSHFPYRRDHKSPPRYLQWRLPNRGQWLIHGHTHGPERVTREDRGGPFTPPVKELHVGLDAWDLRPVAGDELVRLMAVSDAAAGSR